MTVKGRCSLALTSLMATMQQYIYLRTCPLSDLNKVQPNPGSILGLNRAYCDVKKGISILQNTEKLHQTCEEEIRRALFTGKSVKFKATCQTSVWPCQSSFTYVTRPSSQNIKKNAKFKFTLKIVNLTDQFKNIFWMLL